MDSAIEQSIASYTLLRNKWYYQKVLGQMVHIDLLKSHLEFGIQQLFDVSTSVKN